ncbi:prenyltransferase/squalene oxidase repeat-containing protein [Novipirellula galeiformis]|uniref:prenyltransferase/squalene oxidase repeat-containing protein n=1 Tax=Novipirellula galeiformis TaxID=2528004 RepID=UPI0028F40074|nr:prenyltransferase/squalene oxidase repeat-containing protein [Novipirellula galeiformis]
MKAKLFQTFHEWNVKRRLRETPAWLLSTVIHLVLLLVLALITTSSGEIGRLMLTISQGRDEFTTQLVEFSIEPVILDDLLETDFLESRVEIDPIAMNTPIDVTSGVSALPLVELAGDIPMTKLPSSPASMFGGRRGALKQKLLKASGGTETTENAVSLGLRWLNRQQLRDGSWSLRGPYTDGARGENQVSATAMAMLAFMGAGNTHREGEYRKEVLRAVRWLVKQQDRQGFFAVNSAPHEKMYAQAQAMIALCELYAMTGDSWLRPYAQASCNFAVRAQSPQGGWRYQPKMDSDTSVTGWFVMGLKSGEAAGLEVDRYIWPKIQRYFDSVSTDGGEDYYGVGYSYMIGDVATPSMTAEGLLCRQYMGADRNLLGMSRSLASLASNHPIDLQDPDVYYWYYATQSLHHFGGPLWTKWNDQLKVQLPASQVNRGREKGSWSPQNDAWGRHAGRLYTTCFSIFCLEVYYRHMPLYEVPQEKNGIALN